MSLHPSWSVVLLLLVHGFFSSAEDLLDVPKATSKENGHQPNIVFVMLDDVGFADLSYNNKDKMIPTPNIDKLANNGIKFDWHYSHPTCTPSRASLITAKYSCDVGLPFAMVAKSPAGLPLNAKTMPQMLRDEGYSAHMVGKWHLGFASWAQTPIGRGFETHVGNFGWDLTSYEKQIHREPWVGLSIDWVRTDEERNFVHFAEPRHATIAITSESLDVLNNFGIGSEEDSSDEDNQYCDETTKVCVESGSSRRNEQYQQLLNDEGSAVSSVPPHKDGFTHNPLFLYVAYTAAHAPAEPTPEHEKICNDLTLDENLRFPHLWRRLYCGMVVGLDEGVGNLTRAIEKGNGRDTVMVVASDNGGSTWFGGLNYPLRGSKTTVYEGGCRVPALAYDFSTDKRFFGEGGRTYGGLMHFSDWMPTFLGFAGVSSSQLQTFKTDFDWDGFDMGPSIRAGADSWRDGPRKSVLYELSLEGESIFDNNVEVGYRYENWKCVAGIVQDPHYYYESSSDGMNTTDESWVANVGEISIRILDGIFGVGPMDSMRSAITHTVFHSKYTESQFKELDQVKQTYFDKVHKENPHEEHPAKKSFLSRFKKTPKIPLLAPYGGEEGCGVNLAAILSGMQLYDLDKDPEERNNVAEEHPEIVAKFSESLKRHCLKRPQQQRYWLSLKLELSNLLPMMAVGDCSMNPKIPTHECRFQHPFLEDDFDPDTLDLVNGKEALAHILLRESLKHLISRFVLGLVLVFTIKYVMTRNKF